MRTRTGCLRAPEGCPGPRGWRRSEVDGGERMGEERGRLEDGGGESLPP